MRILIIGAGRVGCGALGVALREHDLVFAARRDDVVDSLNRHGYVVVTHGRAEARTEVRGVRAVNLGRPEFVRAVAEADLVYTSVRPDNLPGLAPRLAEALLARVQAGAARALDVFCCENLKNAGSQLERLVFTSIPSRSVQQVQDRVAFSAAISDRIVSAQELDGAGRLEFTAEAGGELLYDTLQVKGEVAVPPPFKGLDNFPACLEEKLYVLNCGHAACAYLGYRHGYTYVHEAIADEAINRVVVGAMLESQRALQFKHGRAVHYAGNVPKILDSFANAALKDRVGRVGRDPIRKLQADDRLVGPIKLAYRYGTDMTNLVRSCAAALVFAQPEDAQAVKLQKLVRERGPEQVLDAVCQLRPWNPIATRIRDELARGPAAAPAAPDR